MGKLIQNQARLIGALVLTVTILSFVLDARLIQMITNVMLLSGFIVYCWTFLRTDIAQWYHSLVAWIGGQHGGTTTEATSAPSSTDDGAEATEVKSNN